MPTRPLHIRYGVSAVGLIICCVWIFGFETATALQIVSQQKTLEFTDGKIRPRHSLTIRVEPADYGQVRRFTVAGDDGVTHNVTIEGTNPFRRFLKNGPLAWSPRFAVLVEHEVCLTSDVSKFNTTAGSGITAAVDPTNRRLLAQGSGVASGSTNMICLPFASCGPSGAPQGLSQQQFEDLNQTMYERMQRLDAYQALNVQWRKDTTKITEGLQRANVITAEALTANRNVIAALSAKAQATDENIQNLRDRLRERFDSVAVETSRIRGSLAATASAISGLDDNERRLETSFNSLREFTIQLAGTVSNLTLAQADDRVLVYRKMRAIATQQRDMLSDLSDEFNQRQMLQVMNVAIQPTLRQIVSDGLLTPFLNDFGQPPALDVYNLPHPSVGIELIGYKYVYQTGGVFTAVSLFLEFRCSTLFLAAKPKNSMSYYDIVTAMYPVGCNSTQGPGMCRCWLEATESTCSVAGSTSVFNGFPAGWFGSPDLEYTSTTNGPQHGCTDQVITGRPVFINSESLLLDQMQTICTRAPQPAGASRIAVFRHQIDSMIVVGNPASVCQRNTRDAFEADTNNVLFLTGAFMSDGYAVVVPRIDDLRTEVYGYVPNNLTWWSVPIRHIGNVQTATCHVSAFVSTTIGPGVDPNTQLPNMLPIYQIVPAETGARTTITIDGAVEVSTQQILDTRNDHLLPRAAEFGVGDPSDHVRIYDMNTADVTINPIADRRESTATYITCAPDPGSPFDPPQVCDLNKWIRINGKRFDHYKALNSPELFASDIDDATGLCKNVSSGEAPWCTRRRFFTITNAGTAIVFHDRETSGGYITTLNFTGGEIQTFRTSACPQSQMTIGLPNQLILVLTSVVAVDSEVVVVLNGPEGCQKTDRIPLGPRQSFSYPINVCGIQSPVQPTVSIFSVEPGGGLAFCGQNFSAAITPTLARDFQGAVDMGLIRTGNTIVADESALAFRRSLAMLDFTMSSLILLQVRTLQAMPNVVVPASVKLEFSDIVERMRVLREDLKNQDDAARRNIINFTAEGLPYEQRLAVINLLLADNVARYDRALAALRAQNEANNATIVAFALLTDRVNNASAKLVESDKKLAQIEINAVNDVRQIQGKGSPGDDCGGAFGWLVCGLKSIFGTMFNVFGPILLLILLIVAVYCFVKCMMDTECCGKAECCGDLNRKTAATRARGKKKRAEAGINTKDGKSDVQSSGRHPRLRSAEMSSWPAVPPYSRVPIPDDGI